MSIGTTERSGERLTDVGRGITLCNESFGSPGDPPVLLFMGLGMQMISWDDELCSQLADRGLYVVRFDNRDAGRSSSADFPPPRLRQLVSRRFDPRQYTLADMADDVAGLMRALELAPAHLVGASLGGMVAQVVAVRHPPRVASLTSIMSNTGSRGKGTPAPGVLRFLLRAGPRERELAIEHALALFGEIGSPGFRRDEERLRANAERAFDRGRNPPGTGRQLAAILKTGDRTRDLREITAPTLVVHGSADRMIRPSGGVATAEAIPDSELMMIEGMGHDLPREVWPRLLDAIEAHIKRAETT